MSHLEKDVELLETAIDDIEEEIEEIIDFIDPLDLHGDGDGDGGDATARANGKVEKARLQLTELLDLIRNMKRDKDSTTNYLARGKKTRISMLEEIDKLKEELDTVQEEKELVEEKLYEQGVKIRRLMDENKELKKGVDGGSGRPNEGEKSTRTKSKGKNGVESGSEAEDASSSDSDSDIQIEQSKQRLSPSQKIDGIIQKQTATLNDLFSKEELHEELTSRYGSRDHALLAFFSRPSVLSSLIDAVVNIPTPPTLEEEDNNTANREIPPVPYTASEILTSGIQPLTDMLCQPSMLQKFFSLLDRPAPLPVSSPIASLWYKVMSHLLQVKSVEMSVYIKDNNILPKVINHINSECVLNLLLTMLNTEAKLEAYGDEFQWSHLQLIDLLAAKLDSCAVTEASGSDFGSVVHHTTALDNISEFLCEILTKYPFSSPLVLQMQETPFVKRLIRNCFVIYSSEPDTNGVTPPVGSNDSLINALFASRLRGPVHCLQILVHILTLSVNGGSYVETDLPPVISELLNEAVSVDKLPAPLHTIAAILQSFTRDLAEQHTQKQLPQESSGGCNNKETKNKILLGEYRMRVLMVAVGLARTGFFWSDHALLESGVLRAVFHLFFSYPWHNVIHSMVTDLVISLLPPQSPPSRASFCLVVLKDLQFFENSIKIAMGQRTGQLGHIANLTTAIQRAAASTPSIADFLKECKEWPLFVQKMTSLTEVTWQSS